MKDARLIKGLIIYTVAVLVTVLSFTGTAGASALTSVSDTMSRLVASTVSNHTLVFTTPTGVGAGETVSVTFASGFNVSSIVFGDIDVQDNGSDLTLAATCSGSTWGAAVASQILTVTSCTGTISTGHTVTIKIGTNASYGGGGTHQITNSTAGTKLITLTAGASDSGSLAVAIVANDQVAVTASVDPTITFSLSDNTTAFGTLSVSSVTTAGTNITLTVGTNANNGYTVTVRDAGSGANPGLYNASASHLIGSTDSSYSNGPTTLSVGTEGYGIYVSGTTGSPTVASRYNGGTGTQVGGLEITDTTIVSNTTLASDTATINHKAAISTTTPAGSYSDTLTYIAVGNF